MGVFDDAFRGTNFEEAFSKTKTVADKINVKGAKYIELSRKKIEYFDTKSKLSKAYSKYGELQYMIFIGEEVDENELKEIANQIAEYREKINVLKEEMKKNEEYNNSEELKKEAERFASDVKDASKEVKDAISNQMKEAKEVKEVIVNQVKEATEAIKTVQNSMQQNDSDLDEVEVTGEQVSSEDM